MKEKEEQKPEQTTPITEEEFKNKIHEVAEFNRKKIIEDLNKGILYLRSFPGKFKSIRRAIKRGRCSLFGDVYPDRPYNNKKRGKGSLTDKNRKVYESIRKKQNRGI